MKSSVSPEVQATAMKIAKGTQKVAQTKEQTKLIAQGIEKGIAEYKKQQKKLAREKDKQRKQQLKQVQRDNEHSTQELPEVKSSQNMLPWGLLATSWLGFIAYLLSNL